eukprot:5591958-Amphidinium_carterae.1
MLDLVASCCQMPALQNPTIMTWHAARCSLWKACDPIRKQRARGHFVPWFQNGASLLYMTTATCGHAISGAKQSWA